ncbi:ABC transporter ATP-binding protein [Caloramator quimbayensis]|nr:ABC transporter ATP-binding protein [Caloramator quimbayensis]
MNKGKVAGFGTHDYLLENNDEYKNMWTAQSKYYTN